ncbi:MAG: MmgE/PrpD family protein [Caldisphaera sp.]
MTSYRDLSERIADWAVNLSYEKLPKEVIEETKKRILDTFGVAIGAFYEKPVSIARWLAESSSSSRIAATIWGTDRTAPADHADFANGCANRYFDFMDTYLSKEALHPSDNIPAIIAAAEIAKADGKKVIEGIVAAYEVTARLADAYSVRSKGWDHVVYIAIASAVGAGKVLGLNKEGILQAINLATVNATALRQTRAGELSMWKGCAAANSSRNGLFAAILAMQGMKGPSPIFSGEFGFFRVALNGDKFDIPKMGGENGEPFKILETSIKYWPVEYHAMSAVDAALKIKEKAGSLTPKDIKKVDVKTFQVSYNIIVKDPEKWDPKTRETADHSLPYIIAVALLDGNVWLTTFHEERYLAKDVREVLSKMKVEVDPEHDKFYPTGIKNTIKVELSDGRVFEESSTYPPGHFKNPLSREGVVNKFKKVTEGKLYENNVNKLIDIVWNLENCMNISKALGLLKIKS